MDAYILGILYTNLVCLVLLAFLISFTVAYWFND